MEIRKCSRVTANQVLNRLAQKGWLQRIKHGVYSIVPLSALTATPMIEEFWTLATKIFEPAYISGWSAAEHWDLTEQIFNSTSLVTQKPQRKSVQTISGMKFRVWVKKPEHFFGTKIIWFGSNKVEVADSSRLIIDIMDKPDFGGGARHSIDIVRAYWNSDMYDSERVLEYAIRYGKGTVMKRLGFLAEQFNAPVSGDWLEKCRNYQSAGISNLDPNSQKKGKISSKWNLRINLPL
jgi:predicted transcriptional regulator of viral defense system